MKPWKYELYKKDKSAVKIKGYSREHHKCDNTKCENYCRFFSECLILSKPKVCGKYHVRIINE